jgi:hypothetical protein
MTMAGGLSAFKGAAKPATGSKKKTDKPEINDPGLEQAVGDWLKAKATETSAAADKALAEAIFLSPAVQKIIDASNEGGQPESSVIINGKVMVSIQDRYGKIGIESVVTLTEIFGEEGVKEYFEEKMEISLTEAALADDQLLSKLVAAVGQDNLERYFDIKRYMAPRPNFHHDRLTKKSITAKATRAMDAGVLTTPKGSVKKI